MPPPCARCRSAAPRASKNLVRAVEVRGCGHAPALMADHQISLVEEFLEPERRQAQRVNAA